MSNATDGVESESAGAGELVVDAGEVSVGTVGVGALLDAAVRTGYPLVGEAAEGVVGGGEGDRFADAAGQFVACGVVFEGEGAA